MPWLSPAIGLLSGVIGLSSIVHSDAGDFNDVRARALDLAYNLDHGEAMDLLRHAIAENPSDPALKRTLAAVIWFRILFNRGAVTVDHYLGSFSRTQVALKQPPQDLASEFRRNVAEAIALSRNRIKTAPRDAQAHYDLGASLGLDAAYIAAVEGRLLAGVRAARQCYDEHERVLELDPSRTDAGLAIGTYRYLVASLPVHMRLVAYVAGFGGGKERGIQMLERAAAGKGEARTDAMVALVLVYNRERRFDAALRVLRELRELYPRNRLMALEEGATLLRAGRAAEAEAALTAGLASLGRDGRPHYPGEEQLWRYKRGAARAASGRADAVDDLKAATSAGAQAWVAGRARVEIARLALMKGDATAARNEARQGEALCREGSDPLCIEEARKLARKADGR